MYKPLWRTVCIDLYLRVYGTQEYAGSTNLNPLNINDCDGDFTVRSEFSHWLDVWDVPQKEGPTVDAYLLWTKRNLKIDDIPELCFGVANELSTRAWRLYNGKDTHDEFVNAIHNAAGVIEGVDHNPSPDGYDPDEKDERGLVAGHELAHIFGEGDHPTYCKGPHRDRCNIMRNGIDKDQARFFFTTCSMLRIYTWHYGGPDDYSGCNEQRAD